MPGEGEISLEQLYKMLHISKRKASWMLNNGIIPCRRCKLKSLIADPESGQVRDHLLLRGFMDGYQSFKLV